MIVSHGKHTRRRFMHLCSIPYQERRYDNTFCCK